LRSTPPQSRRPGPWLAALRALAALVLAACVPAAHAGPADGVKVAPATPGAVRFTVTVPAPELTVIDREQNIDRLNLDGYAANGMPGTPVLPARILTVAIPPVGEVHLTAAATEAVAYEGVYLAPFPAMDKNGKAVAAPRRLAAYGAKGSATPVGARLLGVTWMRN